MFRADFAARSLWTALLLLIVARPAFAQNFTGASAELLAAAEQSRVRSAQFWTGSALPGNWGRPCPIVVSSDGPLGHGCTTFTFAGGEVFNWRMSVSGSRRTLIDDVIPHEVDHMVRASLLRRPLECWLDEGCASLMESAASHAVLRKAARDASPEIMTESWLSSKKYPHSPEGMRCLYVVGFSLVEFLLEQGSPERLLAFQRDDSPMNLRLARHYGLDVQTLRQSWSTWRMHRGRPGNDCGSCGCHLHAAAPRPSSRSTLVIWTASWCPACRKFQADWGANAEFRESLQARYDVQVRDWDVDGHAPAEITTLPAFVTSERILFGYVGPADLLNRLQANVSPEPLPRPTRESAPPVETAPVRPITMPSPVPSAPEPKAFPLEPSNENVQNTPSNAAPVESPGPRLRAVLPIALTALEWAGVIGGSIATGGAGGMATWLALSALKSRRPCPTPSSSWPMAAGRRISERSAADFPAPFPRELDEARELLELRQSEGRVGVLDALRGMFLDDELDKLSGTAEPALEFASRLRAAIDARVEEVAPLAVTLDHSDS